MKRNGVTARRLAPGLKALAVFVPLGLAACATSGQQNEVGAYPSWLISVAEPAAPAIGMAISTVQWRHGRLSSDGSALAYLRTRMQPLDVLLFSNKHRLSGHTGAGLFGHSAVYLGSERELKALGLWSHPAVVPHHAAVREGRLVIESAQAHGTALAPVAHLTDTDRVVLLRPQLGKERKEADIVRLFGFVGKRFDHHYRLDESERVFCTELIELGIPELRLPRRETYGREVILPDDIARQAISGKGHLRFVAYLRADLESWERAGSADLHADIDSAASRSFAISPGALRRHPPSRPAYPRRGSPNGRAPRRAPPPRPPR